MGESGDRSMQLVYLVGVLILVASAFAVRRIPIRESLKMAIAWVLRDPRMTSALIGASRPGQIEDCVGALKNLDFSAEELAEIDHYAEEGNVNLWAASSKG